MSVSTEVQRTLVKSPPELWSEISNPEALARHLSGLGEIRITAVEPETKVEWEAEGASGSVRLKQSGWGTKVTLSVTRAAPTSEESPPAPEESVEAAGAEIETETERPGITESEEQLPIATGAETGPGNVETDTAEPEPEVTSEPAAADPEPVAIEQDLPPCPVEPEPRLGFLARLFRKRKAKPVATTEPEPSVPEVEVELVALAVPEPIYPDPPVRPEASGPAEDLGSELESLEAQMNAETTELLTGVLDRLGAAHHRPFSRG